MVQQRFAILLVFLGPQQAWADNWPEFRGPTGQGLYTGKAPPLEWSTTRNIAWKQPMPGRGWSSPIVHQGRIYLTSAVAVADSKDFSLRALCCEAARGETIWETEVFHQRGAKAPRIHAKNSHASPTPLTDGNRLYVHFGHEGTAALDLDGALLWRNTDLRYAPVHGNGGSPILADGRLVFSCDGGDKQFVVSLDTASGKLLWKTDRKCTAVKKFAFSTPLLIPAGEHRQIISPGSHAVVAYDAATGREQWRVRYEGYSVIPRPVAGHGLVFLSSGYDYPKLLAIRLGGAGDVTDSHIAWTLSKGAPHTPSPLLIGDELYLVSDLGIASCLDARTGVLHWQERIGGNFSASPFHSSGRIYLQDEDGVTTVLRAGKRFERLAENTLEERTFASYAAVDGTIFLRTESHLLRIEQK